MSKSEIHFQIFGSKILSILIGISHLFPLYLRESDVSNIIRFIIFTTYRLRCLFIFIDLILKVSSEINIVFLF